MMALPHLGKIIDSLSTMVGNLALQGIIKHFDGEAWLHLTHVIQAS